MLQYFGMKKDIHPEYHPTAKVICACGNTFTVGSTLPELHIEICSNCHPFYTGKQKLVDSARRIEKFQDKIAKKTTVAASRKGKKVKRAAATAKKQSKAKSKEE